MTEAENPLTVQDPTQPGGQTTPGGIGTTVTPEDEQQKIREALQSALEAMDALQPYDKAKMNDVVKLLKVVTEKILEDENDISGEYITKTYESDIKAVRSAYKKLTADERLQVKQDIARDMSLSSLAVLDALLNSKS